MANCWSACQNDHANQRKQDYLRTVANLIGLALYEKVDIITGDWDQAGGHLEECVHLAIQHHEKRKEPTSWIHSMAYSRRSMRDSHHLLQLARERNRAGHVREGATHVP